MAGRAAVTAYEHHADDEPCVVRRFANPVRTVPALFLMRSDPWARIEFSNQELTVSGRPRHHFAPADLQLLCGGGRSGYGNYSLA